MQMLGNNNNNRFSTMQPLHVMITCSEMKVNTCCAVSDSGVAAFESGSPAEMLGGGGQNTSNNDAAGEPGNMHFVFHLVTADKRTTAVATKNGTSITEDGLSVIAVHSCARGRYCGE